MLVEVWWDGIGRMWCRSLTTSGWQDRGEADEMSTCWLGESLLVMDEAGRLCVGRLRCREGDLAPEILWKNLQKYM